MDLTNIEGIERLECITVFTEVASKLSGKLHVHSFYDSTQQKVKKNWKCDSEKLLNESLLSLLCFIIYSQGSFEKGLIIKTIIIIIIIIIKDLYRVSILLFKGALQNFKINT